MEPTDSQTRLIEKYAKSLYCSSGVPAFDIADSRRVIVHQGKIQKKSKQTVLFLLL